MYIISKKSSFSDSASYDSVALTTDISKVTETGNDNDDVSSILNPSFSLVTTCTTSTEPNPGDLLSYVIQL